ncbi:histidine kinase dimerization/phosphoacceptor domain -containing protein [Paracoccus sp. PAMC 22219]|uniref:histidine kinase dimerization/phosphoacceptor domain -containing protein n=1 Tax=Paracoccus sp. PAMC 22219 TaxID=1569209 RepID=UPI0005A64C05|nr:histidine kinase dimerization/phosphoacceptor domain -containing protein [Paracoccus sp. PAMC 22219]
MSTAHSSLAHADDLTACDREPIHIPGSIQSHGHLLIVDPASGRIVGAAGRSDSLTRDLIGQDLAQVLGGALDGMTDAVPDTGPVPLGSVQIDDVFWDLLAYRSGAHVVIEMLPALDQPPLDTRFLGRMQALDAALERSSSLPDLMRNAATVFRQLTGHARVMIYRFIDDEAGAVVGESRADGMGTFMNHHFPATDIPRQARALYVRNRVRVIADVQAPVQPITGSVPGIETIDLSDSMLRSVSPVHLHYLRNMGVGASASMSIIKDGALWGLVACHHPEPRDLSLATRLACQSMADSLARQIRLREETLLYRERIRLRAHEDTVLARLGPDDRLDQFFAQSAGPLAELVGADGFAAAQGSELFRFGSCPDAAALRHLADHVQQSASITPFVSSDLGRDIPAAQAYRDVASGMLSVTMSTEVPTILMWFRAEKLQVVTWAGNPHKDAPAVPGATLEPRASFAAWSDEVRGKSRPWTAAEIEAASRLVRLMLEARSSRRIRRLNAELSITLRENENLIQQKEFLLREVNHRVQNSLALVASFLRMQGRGADPQVRAQLDEAQSRLAAVSLVHRRLYQDDSAQIVDLSIYLEELLHDMKSSLDPAWSDAIQTEFAPILVSADRAISIGLLVNEVVANAIKYAYGGQPGPVSVVLSQTRTGLLLSVTDSGVGSDGSIKGTGFGMRMVASLVEQLDGQLQSDGNAPGLRVVITAPLD